MRRTAPFLLVLCAACNATQGQLHQSTIERACAPDDVACAQAGVDAPLAVGAALPVRFDVVVREGEVPLPVEVEPVDPDVAGVDDRGRVLGVGEGLTAVLATTPDGVVLDFTHVWVAQATRLALHRDDDERELPATLQVPAGSVIVLHSDAMHGAQALIGEREEAWTVAGDGFELVDGGEPSQRTLQVPASGTGTVSVQALGLTVSVTFEVAP